MEDSIKNNNLKVEIEIECGLDANVLNEVDWFVLSGGTPRKDKSYRRPKSKTSRIVELCTWLGMKVSGFGVI